MASSAKPLIDKLKEQYAVGKYQDYQKYMAKKRVVDGLSKLISSQPIEPDNESSSIVFKVLVRKFKTQLAKTEKDPAICDVVAKKLAKFVESTMKEAHYAQKYKKRVSSVRSFSAVPGRRESCTERVRPQTSRPSVTNFTLEKDTIIEGLGFVDSNAPVVEKVPRSFARTVPKCGPLYTANIGGKKVYVQEVKEGDTKKALISRINSESAEREPTSWLVDLAHKTKEWIGWLDEKASLVDSGKPKELDATTSKSVEPSSSGSGSWIMESPVYALKTPKYGSQYIEERDRSVYKDSSSESSESPVRTQIREYLRTKRPESGSSEDSRCSRKSTSEFYVTTRPTCSKNYTFSSSVRKPSTINF